MSPSSLFPRLRVNCVGVFDVLTFDNSQTNHLALMPQYQVKPSMHQCLRKPQGLYLLLSCSVRLIKQKYPCFLSLLQQADLISLGKVVLALACNTLAGIQRENLQKAMELVSINYSSDLKNLILCESPLPRISTHTLPRTHLYH